MNYVAQEDIILAIDSEINLVSGSTQHYTIKLFRYYVNNQLNESKISLISIALLQLNGQRSLIYSNVYSIGVADGIEIGKSIDDERVVVRFEVTAAQSLALEVGDLRLQVTLVYSN